MNSYSQKGVRIGYIDTEYILENIPEYQEINQLLNSNVEEWKKDIEEREKNVINKRDVLNKERILLTNELIEEREEDLKIEEEEIYQYKQDRFGPMGDFILQKKQLIQPIQDQIFLAIQQIAKTKKYDFIFDKSADLVMLYSEKRYDLSEQILRTILRTNNQKQVESKREKKRIEKESIISKSDIEDPRKKIVEEKKKIAETKRNKIFEDKEAKKIEAEQKRKELIQERENKKTAAKEKIKKIVADKESKKKEIEDKKIKLLEDREQKKKELLEKRKKMLSDKQETNIEASKNTNSRDKILLNRQKKEVEELSSKEPPTILNTEKTNPTIEDRKKLLEEKKKRILEARKAKLDAKKISKDSTFTKINNK
tara:strand:+ start:581 stop:1687 length:1107 start_codon:yes stop_codon:yes gene_type:complete